MTVNEDLNEIITDILSDMHISNGTVVYKREEFSSFYNSVFGIFRKDYSRYFLIRKLLDDIREYVFYLKEDYLGFDDIVKKLSYMEFLSDEVYENLAYWVKDVRRRRYIEEAKRIDEHFEYGELLETAQLLEIFEIFGIVLYELEKIYKKRKDSIIEC
jgi:hypothetical protein